MHVQLKSLKCADAMVGDNPITCVNPSLFYSKPVYGMGEGLFATVDLDPGDIWWVNNFSDPRFVSRVISWKYHLGRDANERQSDETLCYVDPELRQLVICTEPFCRVNHGTLGRDANSSTDAYGNSFIIRPVSAGEEIRIPYDYECVVSLIWKFPEFAKTVPTDLIKDENFLLSKVCEYAQAMAFLNSLA
jgi:hypothetical protein